MSELTLFYLESCPYCQAALKYLSELQAEDARYAAIKPDMVEEGRQRELADRYDYWYVPCFYVRGEKVSEGSVDKAGVRAVLERCLGE